MLVSLPAFPADPTDRRLTPYAPSTGSIRVSREMGIRVLSAFVVGRHPWSDHGAYRWLGDPGRARVENALNNEWMVYSPEGAYQLPPEGGEEWRPNVADLGGGRYRWRPLGNDNREVVIQFCRGGATIKWRSRYNSHYAGSSFIGGLVAYCQGL